MSFGGFLSGDFFFLSSVFMKKYINVPPKKIRTQPSAIRKLKFITTSFCVAIGIETNDRRPPIIRISPRIKIPKSLKRDIDKLNHIFHNNLFGKRCKKPDDYLNNNYNLKIEATNTIYPKLSGNAFLDVLNLKVFFLIFFQSQRTHYYPFNLDIFKFSYLYIFWGGFI